MNSREIILKNIRSLRENIRQIAQKAGRAPGDVEWILVSKTIAPEVIRWAYDAGICDFGENRVQEFLPKEAELPKDIRWHLIGSLQSNKIKDVIGKTFLIHSLDRSQMADKITALAEQKGLPKVACLIQVNSSGEPTKSGIAPQDVEAFVRGLPQNSRMEIKGLMTIGPLTDNRAQIRSAFRTTRQLFDRLKMLFPEHPWEILSMGMSQDYPIAIEEGATLLRIGTAVFGERKK